MFYRWIGEQLQFRIFMHVLHEMEYYVLPPEKKNEKLRYRTFKKIKLL
jgi:hypothetical protein